jgi:hypothetical protein
MKKRELSSRQRLMLALIKLDMQLTLSARRA